LSWKSPANPNILFIQKLPGCGPFKIVLTHYSKFKTPNAKVEYTENQKSKPPPAIKILSILLVGIFPRQSPLTFYYVSNQKHHFIDR